MVMISRCGDDGTRRALEARCGAARADVSDVVADSTGAAVAAATSAAGTRAAPRRQHPVDTSVNVSAPSRYDSARCSGNQAWADRPSPSIS